MTSKIEKIEMRLKTHKYENWKKMNKRLINDMMNVIASSNIMKVKQI